MKTAKRPAAAELREPAKKRAKKATDPLAAAVGTAPTHIDKIRFRKDLSQWFREHARDLPWRGIDDPYATWLSEIMLQQTRVATVRERYVEFLSRFPTLQALAAAPETDVLALWSGLGYYRRARMLHRAAQLVVSELEGALPSTSTELSTLPGVGEYTSAAVASIAFGESVAAVDGNVERVLLRITGEPEEKSVAAHARIVALAQHLVPPALRRRAAGHNPPGDHNQAMMELGAMICLPRAPLCLQCPVLKHCRTRGEHRTLPRAATKSRRVAHLFATRGTGVHQEVLLEMRATDASLMAGMFELPPLPLDAVAARTPSLKLRHGITDTMYEVEVFEDDRFDKRTPLRKAIPASEDDLHWVATSRLKLLPLTGLARKCLVRFGVLVL